MSEELTRVFVYGTLMPGGRNEHVAKVAGGFTARPATLHGYVLYDLRPEGYPGVVRGRAADVVHGWVYAYGPEAWERSLPFLDALEGLHDEPPLYFRVREAAVTAAGRVDAWVYVYARQERLARPGATKVVGGTWVG